MALQYAAPQGARAREAMIRGQSTEISFWALGPAGAEPDPSAGPRGSVSETSPESGIHSRHLGPRHPPLVRMVAQLPTSPPGFHAVLPQPGLLATQPESSFKPPSQTAPPTRPPKWAGQCPETHVHPQPRDVNVSGHRGFADAMSQEWRRRGRGLGWAPKPMPGDLTRRGGDGDPGDGGWGGVPHRPGDAQDRRQPLATPWVRIPTSRFCYFKLPLCGHSSQQQTERHPVLTKHFARPRPSLSRAEARRRTKAHFSLLLRNFTDGRSVLAIHLGDLRI